MSERIGVVVVAYRSAATIVPCVEAILAQPEVAALAVVDNSPDDAIRAVLARHLDHGNRLNYIHRADNPGFARACNLGAASLSGHTHLAFVNPDVTLVRPLAELAAAERTSSFAVLAGGLAPLDTSPLGNARMSASPGRELRKVTAGSGTYLIRDLPPGELVAVGQLDGALLLLSAETFDRLGGFDERFELYYEDVDLCRAAHNLGGCGLLTELFGLHIGGVSSDQSRGPAYAASRVSRIRFFRKWARFRPLIDSLLLLIATLEVITRSLARTSEGWGVRLAAYRTQLTELHRPGSVVCLPHPTSQRVDDA